ncbi:MAG: hypothetical protein ACQETO_10700 [Pseudomonadota bacterium]
MLGKIFLTLAVIIAAALYVRYRARPRSARGPSDRASPAPADNPWHDRGARADSDIPAARNRRVPRVPGRVLFWLALTAGITLGTLLYYQSWQEAREPVTVILHAGDGEPVTYRVRKRDLGDRAFTTLDGTRVTVADSERMEVIGL